MANILGIIATGLAALAVTINFSLHKIEEGHVGVYFRVRSSRVNLLIFSWDFSSFIYFFRTLSFQEDIYEFILLHVLLASEE